MCGLFGKPVVGSAHSGPNEVVVLWPLGANGGAARVRLGTDCTGCAPGFAADRLFGSGSAVGGVRLVGVGSTVSLSVGNRPHKHRRHHILAQTL